MPRSIYKSAVYFVHNIPMPVVIHVGTERGRTESIASKKTLATYLKNYVDQVYDDEIPEKNLKFDQAIFDLARQNSMETTQHVLKHGRSFFYPIFMDKDDSGKKPWWPVHVRNPSPQGL